MASDRSDPVPSRANQPVGQYAVELFYREPPSFEGDSLLATLARRCPDLASSPVAARPGGFVFSHREHTVASGGRRVPVQRAIVVSATPPDLARCEASLSQSWGWPEARRAVSRSSASVLVTDVFGAELPPLHRLILVENVLVALIEAYAPEAIHWQPTQHFVEPQAFVEAYRAAGGIVLMPGPLNVRLFREQLTEDTDAATPDASEAAGAADATNVARAARVARVLMDTLGLAALGLLDLQCRFCGLDPAAVSRVLYNTALYLLESGKAIEDGHTVPGVEPQSRWVCRQTESTALPQRAVLDLSPADDAPDDARSR